MPRDIEKTKSEHRVIGIRHTLKKFKEEGLLDEDTYYPEDAADELKDEMERLALKWYFIGARRGADEAIDSFLDGDLEVERDDDGDLRVVAHIDRLEWKKRLTVTTGNTKRRIRRTRFRISIDRLGFEKGIGVRFDNRRFSPNLSSCHANQNSIACRGRACKLASCQRQNQASSYSKIWEVSLLLSNTTNYRTPSL